VSSVYSAYLVQTLGLEGDFPFQPRRTAADRTADFGPPCAGVGTSFERDWLPNSRWALGRRRQRGASIWIVCARVRESKRPCLRSLRHSSAMVARRGPRVHLPVDGTADIGDFQISPTPASRAISFDWHHGCHYSDRQPGLGADAAWNIPATIPAHAH